VIVLCNVGRRVASPTRLALRVADVLLEEALDPLAPDAPATDVPAAEEQPPPGDVEIPDGPAPAIVSGVYAGSRRSSFFRVWEEQGSLRGAFGSGASFDLSPVAGDAVLITGSEETLTFLLSEQGECVALEYRSRAEADPSRYTKVPPLTPGTARPLVGDYESDELGVAWRLQYDDGRLEVTLAGRPTRRLFEGLVRLGSTTFTDLNSTYFVFEPDDTGAVTRLTVSDPRVTALELERR
jgi:hypothetical protein